jgi:hypothetical protein
LPSETEYEELPKSVVVLSFESMAIMDESCEQFTTVQTFIVNVMEMVSFKDMIGGKSERKYFLIRKCHCPT